MPAIEKWVFASLSARPESTVAYVNLTNGYIAVHGEACIQRAERIALVPKMEELIPRLVAVIDDFLPNVGRCALQNYGELNSSLVDARAILKALEAINTRKPKC